MTTTTLTTECAPKQTAKPAASWRVLGILSTLLAFASIATDLYLPALPAMTRSLQSSPGRMELTISGYLIGFSLGQLAWGPISDRYGRRLPVALGIALFIVGSMGCALATSAEQLIIWRCVQALGGCAGVVIARAMVRDLYEGDRAAQMMSVLVTVMAIAPLLEPIVGGQILLIASWRAIFWTLIGIGGLTLIAILTLPETLQESRRNREPLSMALADYAVLLRQPLLLGYVGTGAFFFFGIFAYVAGTPFAYITYHHLPPQLYGLLFGAGIIGMMATNILNSRLVTRVGLATLLRAGATTAALAGVALAVAAYTGFGGLAGLAVPLFVFVSCNGLIVANAIAGALASQPRQAGAVSAFAGAAQFGGGMAGSALVGALNNGTPQSLGWVVVLAGIATLICAWGLVRDEKRAEGA